MAFELRVTEPQHWRTAADMFRAALLAAPSSDDEWGKPGMEDSWRDSHSISAWDGDTCIGHAGAFHFQVALPGGARVPMAGVTRVGVQQTHRRGGVLSAAMRRLLLDSAEQGKVLAALRASESVIYGRFGFAVAGESFDVQLDRRNGARLDAPVAPGTFRQLTRAETLATVTAVHDRVGFDRPGAINRAQWMHQRYLADALAPDKATYVVVHTAPDGTDDGWVQYSVEWPFVFGDHPGGTCEVNELWGASPTVELALWKYVLELDLIDLVKVFQRPIDDPLRFALANQRHYVVKGRFDEQWLRLLDVHAALQARTYNAAAGRVTIAVHDPLFERNRGTWSVTAEGAERLPGTDPAGADLSMAINGLSAAYLGGTTWHELWACGQVQQHREGAIATADTLFASRPLPRCGTFF